ncbi:MAG: primosomal protein N' [Desulfovibrionaceae bacterium]|nr:primosomal protein N' [Desulfovibrionaceae bacterium]
MHAVPTARVALLSPPFADLSYALPEYLPAEAFFVGQRVAVPLGKGLRVGVISAFESGPEVDGFTLKHIVWPLEKEPLLSESYLDLALQLAHRQTETPGRILGSILPAGLRTTQVRLRFFGPGKPRDYRPKDFTLMPPEDCAACGLLWSQGRAEVSRAGRNPLDAELCVLASDPPWPVRPAAKAQAALLEYLFQHGAVSRRRLADALGKGVFATLGALAGRGLVHIRPADQDIPDESLPAGPPIVPSAIPSGEPGAAAGFSLTPQQRAAFEPLLAAALAGKAESRLLFGITGSGKTAIYLELARAVLAQGRSVLLLAPEVALALKLWGDAAAALPFSVLPRERRLLFHGYQSASAREAAFRALSKAGRETRLAQPRLVVGTRSALLLPLENIGLIILDEEHDASFKQDEGFTYQAKEVAWYRAGRQGALLLMGSATPDVKSFHAAKEGRIPLHILTERVGGGALPEVRLVHLAKGAGGGALESLLAGESLEALNAVVSRGEQAVILLNRRGYAPLMYCRTCNRVAKCPQCDIGLAYHKGRERLLCHYCGHAAPYPSPCPACKSMAFLPLGEGTEKLEESLFASLPPGTGVLRLDRDSTRRPGRMEEILAAFARKEASVLVGTQMLSKGHHFPDVTLAVVADADLGLNLPDYRAAERTFQLLVQSAGRSGRGDKPGQVLIQTRDPGHYCWEYVKNADYEGFFEHELLLRKKHRYPPFVRLALIRISCAAEEESGQEAVTALGKALRLAARDSGVSVLGPAPAPLPFLKGRKRWQCMLKGDDWQALRALFASALALARKTPLRLRLDLDPVNML